MRIVDLFAGMSYDLQRWNLACAFFLQIYMANCNFVTIFFVSLQSVAGDFSSFASSLTDHSMR